MSLSIQQILGTNRPKSYFEKLQDDRWKSRSSDFIRTSGRVCNSCKQTNKTLQTHHTCYEGNREPWEYDDSELVCLCRECHEGWHLCLQILRRDVLGKAPVADLRLIVSPLAVMVKRHSVRELGFALAQLASEPNTFRLLKLRWGVAP